MTVRKASPGMLDNDSRTRVNIVMIGQSINLVYKIMQHKVAKKLALLRLIKTYGWVVIQKTDPDYPKKQKQHYLASFHH